MKKIISLKNEYVSVGSSFGGNQNLFGSDKGIINKGRQLGGCGVVALSDTVSYLTGDVKFNDPAQYKKNFKKTARRILFVPTRFGMTFFQVLFGARHLMHKNELNLRCRMAFSKKDLYTRICRMLKDDIPVILCVPRIYGRNITARSLPFYDPVTLKKVTQTQGHFVVATAVYIDGNDIYIEISSWGKRYFIKYGEFRSFVKKHPISLLGYMMEITRRR
ncbi:MAG: hypothetical protein K5888_06285 [Lachnospiraceae bacterium]|nr:hypothetical protein [Lachnospiraceae bacterium]